MSFLFTSLSVGAAIRHVALRINRNLYPRAQSTDETQLNCQLR